MTSTEQKTILLVEDDAITAMLEKKQLEEEGYRLIHAPSGEKAIEYMCSKNETVDLILMDIDLGKGIDGTETAIEILKNHNIPVLFLSSHTEKDIVRRTENITSYGYVVKNSGITVLDASIRMAFKLFNANMDLQRKEAKLRENEEKYRSLHEQAGLAICYFTLDARIISFNTIALRHNNATMEDLAGKSVYDLYPREEADIYAGRIRRQADLDEKTKYQDYFVLPVGERWFTTTLTRICDNKGSPVGIQVILKDITDMKKAEDALNRTNRSLEQQKKALSILNEIITIANSAEDIPSLYRSTLERALRLLDYDAGGIYLLDSDRRYARVVYSLNLPADFIENVGTVSATAERYHDLFNKGIPIITDHYELVSPGYATKSGFRSVASVPLFSRNTIIGSLNVVSHKRYVISEEDTGTLAAIGRELGTIIERIKAEENSKSAADNLTTLFNSVQEMLFILDMDGRIINVNETVTRRLGYSFGELESRDVAELHMPVRRDEARSIIRNMIRGKTDSCNIPIVNKDGTAIIEVETRITRGIWDNREVLIGVARDISDRIRSEIMFKIMAESAPVAIYLSEGTEQKARYINPKFIELFGYGMDDVPTVGEWWPLAYPDPEYRKQVSVEWNSRAKDSMETGRPIEPMDVVVTCRDGSRKNIMWGFISRGDVNIAYGMDITDRKQAKEKIMNLLREKELILKEVHHRIKNNMSTISGLLSLQSMMQDDPAARNVLVDAARRVQSMIVLYDKLYRAESNNEMPVSEYIPHLVTEIINSFPHGERINVTTHMDNIILNARMLFPLGIIINELVTNSIKYAFTNRDDGDITVNVTARDEHICIVFEDNGTGIPLNTDFDNSTGFGMQLVGMLVEQMQGSVTIDRDHGSRIIMKFNMSRL